MVTLGVEMVGFQMKERLISHQETVRRKERERAGAEEVRDLSQNCAVLK